MTDINELKKIANELVTSGKGILASDSSVGSMTKRLDKFGIESTKETRRKARELFITTPGMEEYISGMIMFDDTIRESDSLGIPFPKILQDKGVYVGVKVDQRAWPMPLSPDEKLTAGLDSLRDRLEEYRELGARFAKWRAVITIGENIPTTANIITNMNHLALYAAYCHEAGLVPIVEPEVVMAGDHDMKRCADVTTMTLKALITQLFDHKLDLEAVIIKVNMILPGSESEQVVTPEEVARATIRVLEDSVSVAIPGVVFLSGGQSSDDAIKRLEAICAINSKSWNLTFSFERALQDPSLAIWKGKDGNVIAAQKEFIKRAQMTVHAIKGVSSPTKEN